MSSRHIAFILNERSSSGRGKRVWDQVVAPEAERLLGKDGFTLHLTQRPRHGTELAIELINQHCADTTQAESSDIRLVIVCVGGDGTVSEVVSGYLDANGVGKGVAIGIIAAGTGNDFVKSIPGYPSKDPAAALRAIIACKTMRISAGRYTCRRIPGQTYGGIQSAVASPALPPSTSTSPPPLATTTALEATLKDTELQIQTVDSGIGNSTADVAKGQRHGYFVNIISCAMSGEVIKNSESSPLVKLLGGTLGYLLLAAWNIFSFRNRRAKITYSRENTTAEPTATSSSSSSSVISLVLNLFLLCICNGQYFGGDMRVSDSAKLDDPNLHAVTVFDSGVCLVHCPV
ncbi:hypothetical protein GQ42DRAFT_157675 [Ramicandelaber brevisporus]|nr:hypothetical protein GQ42DRAFT_157675 [Ramicandelaber brevisporus]